MRPITTALAQATQRAIHDAYAPMDLTPLPEVIESNTEPAWKAWDAAVRSQDTAHQHTMWRAINE